MSTTWPSHFPREVLKQATGGGRLSSLCLSLEAWRRGLSVTWEDGVLRNYTIAGADRQISFLHSLPQSLTPAVDDYRLVDKWETKRHLEQHGLPAPPGVLIDDPATTLEQLANHADAIGYPVVLKPHDGTMGKGVFSGIGSRDELHRFYRHLRETRPDSAVILEKHVTGDDYRVLVVGDRVVAAVRRVPANVVGDGKRSVQTLIKGKNATRGANPFLSRGLINVDLEVESCLQEQELELGSVPEQGRTVWLRRAANASAGGDVVDATDELPEGMLRAAIEATAVMPNIHVAGVDFLHDPGSATSFSIIELNSRPHIGVHMYPTEGEGRDVPKAMIDHFFPSSHRSARAGDPTLAMEMVGTLRLLMTGQVSEVRVAPLPDHGFPVRLQWTLPHTVEKPLRRLDASRVVRAAAAHGIAGSLKRGRNGEVTAVVAGEDAGTCRAFIDQIVELLEQTFGSVRQTALDNPVAWGGALAIGFAVGDELVR